VPPLNAFALRERVSAVSDALAACDRARHLIAVAAKSEGVISVTAKVGAVAADEAVEGLARFGLDWRDATVSHAASIRPLGWNHTVVSAIARPEVPNWTGNGTVITWSIERERTPGGRRCIGLPRRLATSLVGRDRWCRHVTLDCAGVPDQGEKNRLARHSSSMHRSVPRHWRSTS